ncbi:helix-turn-helix domain-containing protein [Streptococcus gallolyticus]
MYYPKKLKNRRLKLSLKQTELAKELGISKQSYFA